MNSRWMRRCINVTSLAVAGLILPLGSACTQPTPSFPVPTGSGGIMNGLGCNVALGDDGLYAQTWVFANFAALNSGEATEVDAHTAFQLNDPSLPPRLARIVVTGWKAKKIKVGDADYLSISGPGVTRDGVQTQIDHQVPFQHGPVTSSLVTTAGGASETHSMNCFFNVNGLPQ
jgi:hypothetical protein